MTNPVTVFINSHDDPILTPELHALMSQTCEQTRRLTMEMNNHNAGIAGIHVHKNQKPNAQRLQSFMYRLTTTITPTMKGDSTTMRKVIAILVLLCLCPLHV